MYRNHVRTSSDGLMSRSVVSTELSAYGKTTPEPTACRRFRRRRKDVISSSDERSRQVADCRNLLRDLQLRSGLSVRRQDGQPGRDPTYRVCQFLLSSE